MRNIDAKCDSVDTIARCDAGDTYNDKLRCEMVRKEVSMKTSNGKQCAMRVSQHYKQIQSFDELRKGER